MKQYWNHFAAAIAALSAAATLLTVLFDLDCLKDCWVWGVIGTVMVVVGSLLYACWQTRSKKNIVLNLSSKLKLSIKEGDLFEQKGVICIPFNEFFDTHVGDGVVGANTLHGLFINKFYSDRIEELKEKITSSLSKEDFKSHPRRKDFCPNKKFPLGTCVDIRDGENLYVLFALTHFDDNDKANVSRIEYTHVVNKLMEHLSQIVQERPVFIPLFGTGLSRIKRTPQRLLLHLVDTLDFNDSFSIPGGLNILIKSLSDVDVNLTTLDNIVKKGITEIE